MENLEVHRNQEARPGARESAWLAWEGTVCSPAGRKARTHLWPGELSPSPSLQMWPETRKGQRGGCNICVHSYQKCGHFFTEVSLLVHLMKTTYGKRQCLLCILCRLRSFSSQRWQIPVHILCLTDYPPERQESQLVWMAQSQDHPQFWNVLCSSVRTTIPVPHQKWQRLSFPCVVQTLCLRNRVGPRGWGGSSG